VVLGGAPGPELHVLTHGATVHRIVVTCGDGVRRDVAISLPGVDELMASNAYMGATVGRYANRIAHGGFELDGELVEVAVNDRGHHLHGGPEGFDRREWSVLESDKASARLRLVSPDGDQGFPGEVTVDALFRVQADGVELELSAVTTRPTVVNLTSHVYLNLDGGGSADDHLLRVPASAYTPVDPTGIPLGEHQPVDGTPFDLRTPVRVGDVVRNPDEQVAQAGGFDHNLVVDGSGWRPVARLESQRTRTSVELWSDQPCLQVFTGNALDGASRSRSGPLLRQGDAIALEPQLAPDTPNHPDWPSAVLRPGETYRSRIAWRFGALA
jgi:aldose 1-epimerase